MTRAAIYARVSTDKQTAENQIQQLAQTCKDKGWDLTKIYQDVASGSKGRDQRPQLDAMLKDASRAKFEVVMVWSLDRLGRSVQNLYECLSVIQGGGRDLFVYTTALDTTTPAGKAMFGMVGVFAQFERELIQERVHAGLNRARAAGVKLGRPAIPEEKLEEVRKLRADGLTYDTIAKLTGVPKSSVGRIISESKAA